MHVNRSAYRHVASAMREVDYLKETVSYLKFWQGVIVVTNISVIGWTISAFDNAVRARIVLALSGITVLSLIALLIHRRITSSIELIRKI